MNRNLLILLLVTALLYVLLLPSYLSPVSSVTPKEKEENENLTEEGKQKTLNEEETKLYLMGKFDPAERKDFILVPTKYSLNKNNIYLRDETLSAFIKMSEAAAKDNINLKIVSATRNFEAQKKIWEDKWHLLEKISEDGVKLENLNIFREILEYSAAPGTSRHHWGTDIDLNNTDPLYFNTEEGGEIYSWLYKNAKEYGFCQPYNTKNKERPTGYNEEKWHWSYLPLAKEFLTNYKKLITEKDLAGFAGDEYVSEENLINNYVLGINGECF